MTTLKGLLTGALVLCCALPAHGAGVFRVDADSATAVPDGQSWATAYRTLQAGTDAASAAAGGEVWVKAGTYTATTNPVLTMKAGVALYGGFAGTETVRDQRNWASNPATIDGEGARRCVIGAHNATLDGFTVTRGSAGDGGGMYNCSSVNVPDPGPCSPTVANCLFTGNVAGGYGGGMCNAAGASAVGSMSYRASASPKVANCRFMGNSAAQGGGMCNYSAADAVCYTTCGAAAYADAGAMLENCVFSGNTASLGGGMQNLSQASSYYFYASALSSASPVLTNCSFSGNAGGAMRNDCTRNDSPYSSSHANPNLTNCILWGDAPATLPEIDNSEESAPLVKWSCVRGGHAGMGNISGDPLFSAMPAGLQLQPGSPCINAGTAMGAPAGDIAGVVRPQGAGVDMGAYEYNGPWVFGGIVINNAAKSTASPNATLSLNWSSLSGSPVTQMRFSDDGAHWTLWEPLVATRPYTLPGPDGYRTVRVQYRDGLGNLSDRLNDYIMLDATAPTGTIVINNGATSTKSPEVTLSLTWSDGGGSGVTRMRFSDNGSTWTAWEPVQATRTHTLPLPPGRHQTVRVQYRDNAGNYSARFSDYIRLDLP